MDIFYSVPLLAEAVASDGWVKGLIGLVGGIAATFLGFVLNQRHQNDKDATKALRDYIVALQSAANELEFYGGKLTQLSSELSALETKLEAWRTDWIIPTYSIYPDFLEKCKTSISAFFKNPDLVKEVGHCHFELCHILERLDLLKVDLRVPLESDASKLTLQLRVQRLNVKGFKGLVDSNLPVFRAAQDALLAEKTKAQRDLETRQEQSLLSASD